MAKQNPTLSQFNKKGFVFKDGHLVKSESLVDKKPVKITPNKYLSLKKEVSKALNMDELDDISQKISVNKKVIGATKIEVGGVKFDSKLEQYMYSLLKASKIDFEFQKVYTLQEKFRYGTEAIRAITLTVDFYLPSKNLIIDTKGHQTSDNALRWKLLKYRLMMKEMDISMLQYRAVDLNELPQIFMPSTKAECDALLNRILYEL